MARFTFTITPRFPPLPKDEASMVSWAKDFQEAILARDREIVGRLESIVVVGTFAERPAADGTYRFYFANDTNALYFDDGAWNAI